MDKISIDLKKNDKKGGFVAASLDEAHRAEVTYSPGVRQVALQSPGAPSLPELQALWSAIRTRARWMAFPVFEDVVRRLGRCGVEESGALKVSEKALADQASSRIRGGSTGAYQRRDLDDATCFHGPEAYNLLKATAEAFLAFTCSPGGVLDSEDTKSSIAAEESTRNDSIDWTKFTNFLSPSSYPYLQKIKPALLETVKSPFCDGLRDCFCPVELIWSYWHEEGMLVQTLNAICLRFQNKRGANVRDPLATLRLSPLRPLSTLLWGYIQDEHSRLTVARRAYEYDHEYGLRLMGRVVANLQTVDSRSKFLEAFHNLLHVTNRFYKDADDTTVKADAFPVLNALKELHLILAQGAHNQFGDLPWTARVEMLIQKWLLSRPEIREFLGGAPMVPYKESWMAHADSMKTLQGWSDVSVSHYRDLGVFGEQILLSVRYADWNSDDATQEGAYTWAIYWRTEIQSYVHCYRAVTGVDLTAGTLDAGRVADRYEQPSVHQARRLKQQRDRAGGTGAPIVRPNGAVVR
ncbi:MAG: hypothetical protein AB7O66_23685 [Limisphaerales bacterium]